MGAMNEFKVLDPNGHSLTTWDTSRPEEVETARRIFDELMGRGYRAFRMGAGEGVPQRRFEPQDKETVLVPPIRAGERMTRMRALRRLLGGFDPERRAHERALELLLRSLTAEQRADFARSKTFRVRAPSGQHYRVTYGNAGNVEALTAAGAVSRRLCAGPLELPIPAVMLAQKLMLETQESEFLRIAALGPGTTVGRGFLSLTG